ncbi:MAG: hypothetical protein VXY77_02500 [Pseudomonadota bacterium]|nr:hypothetical protein [Pseudomonadota bacterium]
MIHKITTSRLFIIATITISGLYALSYLWTFPSPAKLHSRHTATITIQSKQYTEKLRFKGLFTAKILHAITSPAHGTVTHVYKNYGETVTAGEKILDIHSKQLNDEFNKTLLTFLESKEKLIQLSERHQYQLKLFTQGAIAKNDHTDKSTEFYKHAAEHVSITQHINLLCKKLHIPLDTIHKLHLSDTASLESLLTTPHSVSLLAPDSGILQLPLSSNHDKKTEATPLLTGNIMEEHQSIANVSAPDTFEIKLEIPEHEIRYLKKGLVAHVANPNHPKNNIQGRIKQLNLNNPIIHNQKEQYFTTIVEAKCIFNQCTIPTGSTVFVDIELPSQSVMQVPMTSVSETNPPCVSVYNQTTHQYSDKPIIIQKALQNTFIITGLAPGEIIAANYPTTTNP